MRIVYFTHSLRSCWNHGNAHFLRGVLSELAARGHEVLPCEPEDNWSLRNMRLEPEAPTASAFESAYPLLKPRTFSSQEEAVAFLNDADLVLVHEWNEPSLVAAIGEVRARGGRFHLLFHDTHHRAVSDPEAIRVFDLSGYDGILAFGATLARVYEDWGWTGRVHVWHEAADIRLFKPPKLDGPRAGAVWIGNWGDGERSEELQSMLLEPMLRAEIALDVYGVRYPPQALDMLRAHGAAYHGWLPNLQTPETFGRHLLTVHVPRRFYRTHLPGIPTIRVFEALACGIPLVSAEWQDAEHLFTPGEDYLQARDGAEMTRHLRAVARDPELRAHLTQCGLATIRAKHTCAHRVDELMAIDAAFRATPGKEAKV
jgi:spore maturation protein CgeB